MNRKSKIKNRKSTTAWGDDDDADYVPPEHRELPPELVRLSDWGPRDVEWLWTGMIPLRKVTLLVGEPEKGKTFFALDLAARVSAGWGMPGEEPTWEPGGVLILSADDELDDTIVPRLKGAFADLSSICVLTVDGPRHIGLARPQISFSENTDALEQALRAMGHPCRLIIIDPITAFLDGMSANSHIAVRRLFARLTSIAKRFGAAVLLISHNRKAGGDSACHRVIGSLAFTAAARVVFGLVDDPAIAERRLLLPIKMNLRDGAVGRAFHIADRRLEWERDPVSLRPDELKRLDSTGLATADRLQGVVEQLRVMLKDGPRLSREIHEEARRGQVPRLLLFAAKAQLGVRAFYDGRERQWRWGMPASVQCPVTRVE